MDDVLRRSQEILASYEQIVRAELPEGAEIFDAHVHLGTDIDGMVGDFEELVAVEERYGISGAFMFCLDEPDRHPAFSAANDRTLAYAERSNGRLVPFVRLDLAEQPIEEARRCLDAGARGIKLHPRAQKFLLNDERLAPVFELAAERRVPILIHGGRGLPPIADSLAELVERYDGAQLIIAHCGIADLAALAERFSGRPGVFFDTSVWSALDVLDLFRLVAPEQVLYASDYPYGQQPASLLLALRTAKLAGLDEPQLRALLGGSAQRIANGEEPLPLSSPQGPESISQPLTFARIHAYLSMATPLLWTRQADTIGVLGLALNACDERANGHREETEQIRELLLVARDLWRTFPEVENEQDRVRTARLAFRLLHLANITAVTSAA
ncbi:MAG: amidohydrolase family protein [Actinobacteria bacterium]|nr:amidohydrolase family protein [Actinomycetota bacterium]